MVILRQQVQQVVTYINIQNFHGQNVGSVAELTVADSEHNTTSPNQHAQHPG
jgi:hypothetical protein